LLEFILDYIFRASRILGFDVIRSGSWPRWFSTSHGIWLLKRCCWINSLSLGVQSIHRTLWNIMISSWIRSCCRSSKLFTTRIVELIGVKARLIFIFGPGNFLQLLRTRITIQHVRLIRCSWSHSKASRTLTSFTLMKYSLILFGIWLNSLELLFFYYVSCWGPHLDISIKWILI